MPHGASLVATIVMGLVLAFGGGFLASRLRIPPLVGYLLAGVIIGPFTPGFVADLELAGQLAEIGVILLMFGIGLHFSFDDLRAVRRIALPGALAQIAVATAVGAGIAMFWGWGAGAALVFGLALSVASTVVLLRVLEERNILQTLNGRIAVGWLIVEDLAMVLVLVLLPALTDSLGGTAHGPSAPAVGDTLTVTLALTLGKVALFIALALHVGRRIVPWLLAQVARTGSRELFTLAVLATALGIAYGSAELFGVSFALGAFFAGVVLSESDLSHQAAGESLPLRDAFAVLFFVSVGMLFNPWIVAHEPLAVIAVLFVIMVVKPLAAFGIVLAFRYPVGTALVVSASRAQIGEFSFILAGLGVAFDLLPPSGRDLVLAGALLSITLNPLVFGATSFLERWLRRRPKLMQWLDRPDGRLAELRTGTDEARLRDHAVIVGYGRVGGRIGEVLAQQGVPFIVVEQNRQLVEALRQQRLPVVYGDASVPGVLARAHIDRARLLVLAAPDGFQAREMLDLARKANPRIDTVVRTHSSQELAYLERQGVGMALMAERELALGMADYALRSFGFEGDKVRLMVQGFRVSPSSGKVEETASVMAGPPAGRTGRPE